MKYKFLIRILLRSLRRGQRCEYNIHSQKRHRLVSSCQFYCRLVATCQQVATSLSISSSCNKSVKIRLVATCHLQTCYNMFATTTCNNKATCKQLATSLLTTNLDNQHAWNKSVDNLQQTYLNKTPARAFTPPADEKKMGTIWIFVYCAVYGSGRGRCRDFLVLKWGGGS